MSEVKRIKKSIHRGMFAMFIMLAAVLILGFSSNVYAQNLPERDMDELKSIASSLLSENSMTRTSGVEMWSQENIYLHPFHDEVAVRHNGDFRNALLTEIVKILSEAANIQYRSSGIDENAAVIVKWAGSFPSLGQYGFEIIFLREEHMALVDFILEFSGIPKEITTIAYFWPAGSDKTAACIFDEPGAFWGPGACHYPYECELCTDVHELGLEKDWSTERYEEDFVNPEPHTPWWDLPMGTRLHIQVIDGGTRPFSMGSPRSAADTSRGFSAGHGRVEVGASVRLTPTGTAIGSVRGAAFHPEHGLDLLEIQLYNISGLQGRVSTAIPQLPGRRITIFAGSRPQVNTLVTFAGAASGNQSGRTLASSVNAYIPNLAFMRNMIRVDIPAIGGDSGSALLRDTVVAGILCGSARCPITNRLMIYFSSLENF
ncbi:MAG: S1 family peptidase [Clostridiales bacterium]|nr:S1 family peptidase [Clostridiales bacterium]